MICRRPARKCRAFLFGLDLYLLLQSAAWATGTWLAANAYLSTSDLLKLPTSSLAPASLQWVALAASRKSVVGGQKRNTRYSTALIS